MNPYVFNPYTLAAAQYNAAVQSTNGQAAQIATNNAAAASAVPNAYSYAAALNATAALNAYRNMAAMQQQTMTGIVGGGAAVGLNAMNGNNYNNNNNDATAAAVGQSADDEEDEDDDDGDIEVKNKKNRLVIEKDGFFNMKPLLAENILSSDYFKSLFRFKTYHEVIDETARFCKNVEPLMVGLSRKPSTAFCILYKFFSMELTVRQVQGLLDYYDNAFVRAIGFLYLRYLLPAKDLWKWFSPYFDDDQEFSPGADGKVVKMKDFAQNLLQQQKYYGTLLPRIPHKIERAYKTRLLKRQMVKQRDVKNEEFRNELMAGAQVRAQWQDLKWYAAVIDECCEDGQFVVTFTDYDDQCTVSIGQIQRPNHRGRHSPSTSSRARDSDRERRRHRSRSHSRDRKHKKNRKSRSRSMSSSRSLSRSPSRSGSDRSKHKRRDRSSRDRDRQHHRNRRTREDRRDRSHRESRHRPSRHDKRKYSDDDDDDRELEELVRRKEMEACVAVGRDYARRPTAYYHSLTLHLETGTNRKRSPSPPASNLRKKKSKASNQQQKRSTVSSTSHNASKQPSKEHLEKMRLLKQRYGDAAARK